jgi:hypothetical protein
MLDTATRARGEGNDIQNRNDEGNDKWEKDAPA